MAEDKKNNGGQRHLRWLPFAVYCHFLPRILAWPIEAGRFFLLLLPQNLPWLADYRSMATLEAASMALIITISCANTAPD
tara:strand:+ start:63019 stop:63258 length:240 start_codon:yes stop_codon:yes gene_type:complete